MIVYWVTVLNILVASSLSDAALDCEGLQKHKNIGLLPTPPNCGPIKPLKKVMGGDDAEEGEFPWIVTIYNETVSQPGSRQLFCDGSILTTRYVITAAHCTHAYVNSTEYKLYVRLREHDVTSTSTNPVEIPVESIIQHEGYNLDSIENDISLMRLSQDMEFNRENIYPICLPLTCDLMKNDQSESRLMLAGWGFVQEGYVFTKATTLQKSPMKIVPHADCQEVWSKHKPITDDKQLCTRGEAGAEQSACRGDSGGPLMARLDHVTYLVGLVSMGFPCVPQDPSSMPNVFTKVTAYNEWILDHIK